ncbi:MAG: response regulator [Elusimicrobiota bacterium]
MNADGMILVVDDEPSVRSFCARVLSASGFVVKTAQNAHEALSVLEVETPDLVLSDLWMPYASDGQRLLEEIKRRSPSTDVVIMTSYPDVSTAVPAFKNGACEYLGKPFSEDALGSAVRRRFEERRMSAERRWHERMQEELSAAYSELEKTERLKDAVLSRLNHELRTPMAVSLMSLECLSKGISDGWGMKLCGKLRSGLDRLRETVEDLLLFKDLQREGSLLRTSRVDVIPVLERAIAACKPLYDDKGIAVRFSVEGEAGALEADERLLETAFKHLLLNAIHFNRKGGGIDVRVGRQRDGLAVSFADTGIGIPEEKRLRVFDGFYQAADHMTRKVGGLGLGLAIVRRIVEAHGGGVFVESREGEGSVFTVAIPFGEPMDGESAIGEGGRAAQEASGGDLPGCPPCSIAEAGFREADSARREEPYLLFVDDGMPQEGGPLEAIVGRVGGRGFVLMSPGLDF